jgi:hypothetical protein
MLVLLRGVEGDPPLEAVRQALSDLGVPSAFADQGQVLDMEIQLIVGESVTGFLRLRDGEVDFSKVTAVYVRPYDVTQVPAIAALGPQTSAWRHALEVEDIIDSWCEVTPALVVNRLGAVASNNSKPYQLRLIHSFGFAVPETLVTTDPDVARAFWEKHGEVIYKSISATRSRVSRLLPEHVERLSDVSSCPTQFQEYIPGIDHRVHVIGDEVFACQVLCEADDYRSPGSHTIELQACQLPEEIEDRCWRLTAALQLSLAGIDLRRTPEGRWICFEVNTSPAFTYYEQGTRQPIADAIARHLANGCSGPRLIHPFATPSPDGRTRREPVRSVHAGDHGLAREAPHRH